jgi:putative protease
VVNVDAGAVTIDPAPANGVSPLKPGDGLVFDAAGWRSPQEEEEGGRVYAVTSRAGRLELRFGTGDVNFTRIRPGDLVWRTHDPDLDKAARPYTSPAAPVAKQLVDVRVTAREGQPLEMEWTVLRPDLRVRVTSPEPLVAAQNSALTTDFLRDQIGRLGNTPYQLATLQADIEGRPFVPSSLLNRMRRDAVEGLQELQGRAAQAHVGDPQGELEALLPRPNYAGPHAQHPQLHLLVRNPEQLEAAIALEPASITLDYLDLYGLKPSVDRLLGSGIAARVASPRVLKPGEGRIAEFLARL